MTARRHNMLYALFFLSGATALVYQVVWTRLLTLFFGSTTLAVSTVLAVFMGGLAIGSALFGGKADATTEPVRLYGRLELAVGLFAIASPLLFPLMEKLYLLIHAYAGPGFWQAAMIRFGLASLLLLPPTILMGGTLPVLSKVFIRDQGANTGRSISLLYFINTSGAVTGALAAGLFLMQILGARLVLAAGGMINVGIFFFANRLPVPPVQAVREEPSRTTGHPGASARWSRTAVLAVFTLFFSGMAALMYEVAWTRVLTLVIGSSTYAFTVMLATFLTGIAAGSALIARYAAARKPGTALLALCQLLVGVFALGTASLFNALPDAFVTLFGVAGGKFGMFVTANFLLCFVVMVPATLFMGASFPVAGALVVERFGSSGRRIGLLAAGNTAGAILGAFLAGFVFLPRLGIQDTVLLAVSVNLVCGLLLSLFVVSGGTRTARVLLPAGALTLLLILAFVWRPSWDKLKMTSGPYAYAVQYQNIAIEKRLSRIRQLFYREGPVSTVSVIQEGKHIRLVVDGKSDAGNFRDMTTQVLLGHLPLLVKPEAADVLVIGFASGITAGAVARHGVRSIDCVEIEPAMRDASRYFVEENYGVIGDGRFHLILDDARTYLPTAGKKYDLIISEPSNPWQAGSSRLFTREAFQSARNSLKDGGVMAQWMHLYGVDAATFRIVVRTFLSVYPHAALWMDPDISDVILLGSARPISIDPVKINRLFRENPRVSASLSRIGYGEAWTIFRAFALREEDATRFAGMGELNTDNLPYLEYRAPKSLYASDALRENVRALREIRSPESSPLIAVEKGDAAEAAALLKSWATSLAKMKATDSARGALVQSALLDPGDSDTHYSLALLRMRSGDAAGALQSFKRAADLNPGLGGAHAYMGALFLQAGKLDEACRSLERAVALGEESSAIMNNLAVIRANQGRLKEAVRLVDRVLTLNPADEAALRNRGAFQMRLSSGSDR